MIERAVLLFGPFDGYELNADSCQKRMDMFCPAFWKEHPNPNADKIRLYLRVPGTYLDRKGKPAVGFKFKGMLK